MNADDIIKLQIVREVRGAHAGYDPSDRVACCLCGWFIARGDAGECSDGHLCVLCELHPRFDFDVCPDCDSRWSDTIRKCPGCGLTIEAVAERAAAGDADNNSTEGGGL